jgi:hypothetical protein
VNEPPVQPVWTRRRREKSLALTRKSNHESSVVQSGMWSLCRLGRLGTLCCRQSFLEQPNMHSHTTACLCMVRQNVCLQFCQVTIRNCVQSIGFIVIVCIMKMPCCAFTVSQGVCQLFLPGESLGVDLSICRMFCKAYKFPLFSCCITCFFGPFVFLSILLSHTVDSVLVQVKYLSSREA